MKLSKISAPPPARQKNYNLQTNYDVCVLDVCNIFSVTVFMKDFDNALKLLPKQFVAYF